MRGVINDAGRALIGAGIGLLGVLLELRHSIRVYRFASIQRRLSERYGLGATTPVRVWGPEVSSALQRKAGAGHAWASTSGTTSTPKAVPYSSQRLRGTRLAFVDMYVRACRPYRIRRRSLYVMVGGDEDGSLTALLLRERGAPPALSLLQAPYRVQASDAIRDLAQAYGDVALRLWVIAIANPGVLYATNPSTLAAFFDRLASDWPTHSRLVREFDARPSAFAPEVRRMAARLASRGSRARLKRIAMSDRALPVSEWAPALEAYICWTGGYVTPFLDRIARHLPAEQYRLLPMYAMSTETIETVPHYGDAAVAFLPLARGVCCEFLPEEADPTSGELLGPAELRENSTYSLVVSDAYGLRRYQTGDVFVCRGFVNQVPNLAFVRRLGLAYSFTGEKLTGTQAAAAIDAVMSRYRSVVGDNAFAAFVPSAPAGLAPHYTLLLACPAGVLAPSVRRALGADADGLLCELNSEYRAKRESERLGTVMVVDIDERQLARTLHPGGNEGSLDSQFKFLPLYPMLWGSGPTGPGGKDQAGVAAEPVSTK